MHPYAHFTPFTITKTWKHPNCLLTEEWIKKMWYIYTMEHYSTIKENEKNAIYSNMDKPGECHTERNKTEKEKYMTSLMCGI